MRAAEWFVYALSTYGLVGLLFAVAFAAAGVRRVDPVAKHAPWGFRLIILPGVAALWPWLLRRWVEGARP